LRLSLREGLGGRCAKKLSFFSPRNSRRRHPVEIFLAAKCLKRALFFKEAFIFKRILAGRSSLPCPSLFSFLIAIPLSLPALLLPKDALPAARPLSFLTYLCPSFFVPPTAVGKYFIRKKSPPLSEEGFFVLLKIVN
jgi:hypothetical protein